MPDLFMQNLSYYYVNFSCLSLCTFLYYTVLLHHVNPKGNYCLDTKVVVCSCLTKKQFSVRSPAHLQSSRFNYSLKS